MQILWDVLYPCPGRFAKRCCGEDDKVPYWCAGYLLHIWSQTLHAALEATETAKDKLLETLVNTAHIFVQSFGQCCLFCCFLTPLPLQTTAWLLEGCEDTTLDKQNMTDCAAPGFMLAVKLRGKKKEGWILAGAGKHMTSFVLKWDVNLLQNDYNTRVVRCRSWWKKTLKH